VLIGFANAGLVVASPATLIQEGVLTEPKVLIAAGAFVLMFAMAARGVIGAVLIGIVVATAAGMAAGLQPLPAAIVSPPPSLTPTFLQFHFTGAAAGLIATSVFVFLLIDMLDTSGTLTAVAQQERCSIRMGACRRRGARLQPMRSAR
jgi:AGZA family xanthine/uracil permease-like MFS transporter